MKKISQMLLYCFFALGSILITLSSWVYFDFNERAPFLIEKLPLSFESLYIFALRIHVLAAALSLPGCLLLTSKSLLKRYPRFHRHFGRMVGFCILIALAPSGFYLALFARGGFAGTFGFWLSGGIVVWAMLRAIHEARAKRYARHRVFTFHVLGQLGVAVLSRAILVAFDSYPLNPDLIYLISLWIPVVGTFIFIEFFFSPTPFQFLHRRIYDQTINHSSSFHELVDPS
ncbi:MAG: DUF2306 domain-containing protein [Deltaproteobacteria bacterium]|nr:DUF2306 domain-containing protein [Deltaproteobacteria bacterium]